MAVFLSPPKLVLLAVHLAVKADIDSLASLAAHHGSVLRKELLLRILLTYLPETLRSSDYVTLIEHIERGDFSESQLDSTDNEQKHEIDISPVESLTEEEAIKKVKKLRLLPLSSPEAAPSTAEVAADDTTSLFLLRRSYKVDEEAGLLTELPALLTPFLDHSPAIRWLLVSTILPLLRRNCEYYPNEPIPYTLAAFQRLPDRTIANLLLSQTGAREEDYGQIGRDLKGMIAPWMLDKKRWNNRGQKSGSAEDSTPRGTDTDEDPCPGWNQVLRWLTSNASKSWRVAANAFDQWEGPQSVDLGGILGGDENQLNDEQRRHLDWTYAQAALASTYLISDASVEALEGAYAILNRAVVITNQDPLPPLQNAVGLLAPLAEQVDGIVASPKNATYLRNDLLESSNVLTWPTETSTAFCQALIISAFILTRAGSPCTLRRVGELALLQDEREQKAEALKLIHALANQGPKTDDKFWMKSRDEILWLRDWGAEDAWGATDSRPKGIFSQLKKDFLEVEFLKALLTNTRYALAKSIYEDSVERPLDEKVLKDAVFSTAMTAYDNASNPNRTRGGLKKCDDIIKAFPNTISKSDPVSQKIEALLQATHALSEFRLVLKQGEPFTPVVLRVHADPISIIDRILEQNPKSYTRLHDLLDLGTRMVKAGLTATTKTPASKQHHSSYTAATLSPDEEAKQRLTAERRIIAMCIDAALTEDDFETAYSYILNRLSSPPSSMNKSSTPSSVVIEDDYSWKAALQAGKYRRTSRTVRPTHLGTNASANPEIRHLEQRIECLSTALRIAPTPTLQEILNAYRRAEEELDSALKAEEEAEDAWDAAGDSIHGYGHGGHRVPGAFGTPPGRKSTVTGIGGGSSAAAAAARSSNSASRPQLKQKQTEEAPMSLFDLSRASVLSAQKNLSALSSLQRVAGGLGGHLGGVAGGLSGSVGGLVGGFTSSSNTTNARNSISSDRDRDRDMRPGSRGSASTAGGGMMASSFYSDGGDDGNGSGNGNNGHGRVRKRDQLREAAMGTLVSGVGWLVGAPAPAQGTGGNGNE
ncbi:secretory pathway protein Sec39-domain-containing protein [Neurospora tetraspora]|uniref:Secretory pathway protein Sec39-domain-containing protein n=1 Tax=Neurospora tetraspora TaxID=94610 RepID=A0AAE0JLV1_9PEZI|nr:secretory pathway protein Sec39-domain-containing protein [Neurospora tetraspora]